MQTKKNCIQLFNTLWMYMSLCKETRLLINKQTLSAVGPNDSGPIGNDIKYASKTTSKCTMTEVC